MPTLGNMPVDRIHQSDVLACPTPLDVRDAFAEFLSLDGQDRRDVLAAAANRLDTPPGYVEKDLWVCVVLDAMFNGLPDDHPRLLFKGGTSRPTPSPVAGANRPFCILTTTLLPVTRLLCRSLLQAAGAGFGHVERVQLVGVDPADPHRGAVRPRTWTYGRFGCEALARVR